MVVQDPLHRVPGDVVAEVGERAADPRVAPRRILIRHPYDEFGPPPWVSSAVPDAGGHCHRTAGRSDAGTSGESCQA